jgi:hypothetical protein
VTEDNPHYLKIIRENADKNSEDRFELLTMDLDDPSYEIPPTEVPYTLTMLSADFQK